MTVILPSGWTGFTSGCCVDTTERGQQLVVEELAFNQVLSINGTRRTSWGYVSPDGDITTLIGNANCAGGNMTYQQIAAPPDPVCCQLNHFVDGNPLVFDHPALVLPNPALPAVNTVVGSSDEPIYFFAPGGAVWHAYYPDSQTRVVYNQPGINAWPPYFAKAGDRLFVILNNIGSALHNFHVIGYDAQAGGVMDSDWTSLLGVAIFNANITADRFICLCADQITGAVSVKKLSLVDGSILQSIDITDIGARRLFAVSNNLIYIAALRGMYYLSGTNLVFVGKVSPTLSAFGGNAVFAGGTFYYGPTGFGDSDVQIRKIAIPCPEAGAIIASISTGATVAAGAAINVTWSGILDPTAGDRIELRPAPVGGALGFTGAALATLNTGGPLSAGTLPFTIPALTTPGNYIFNLTRTDAGVILIATSNVFAVT